MYGTYCRLGVHIGASWRDVVRATRRKFQKRYRRHRAYRAQRHALYRAMLEQHKKAQDLARSFRL